LSTYLLIIRRHCIHNNGIFCCIYSASRWSADKCLKHIEANRNKRKANSASCWSYYTDMLWCTGNKRLSPEVLSVESWQPVDLYIDCVWKFTSASVECCPTPFCHLLIGLHLTRVCRLEWTAKPETVVNLDTHKHHKTHTYAWMFAAFSPYDLKNYVLSVLRRAVGCASKQSGHLFIYSILPDPIHFQIIIQVFQH
jgi:hypothetical protein